MKVSMEKLLVLFSMWITLLKGSMVNSLPYDYSASIECLAEPLEPHYKGGIIRNPGFNSSLDNWSVFGYGNAAQGTSVTGNKYAVAHSRTQAYHSISQKVYLHKETHYTLSAWFQVSAGSADVRAVFKTGDGFVHAGGIGAKSGCWSMLKGGLTAASSGPAELYFESNATADVWVDSVSLQPFTRDEWRTHRAESTNKARKKTVRLQAKDSNGNHLPGARLLVEHVRNGFPLGAAMSHEILDNRKYQRWFTSRFTVATFENEMKWYTTEVADGKEDYSRPDAMLRFARDHGIAVRGHNVFWDDPSTQMGWVGSLGPAQLRRATSKRIKSVVSRYRGQLIAWDVVNENLHYSFYESKFGKDASSTFYRTAHHLDKNALLFLNEYNTLEQPGDMAALPSKYLQKLRQIKSFPGNAKKMAIGLEGHFTVPNIPYMRAALDTLAQAGVPIWLTEIDVAGQPNQAYYLEEILREAYAHPAVHGIVLWTAWHPEGCYVMCLTDNNFRNLPQGEVVDRLIREWRTRSKVGVTNAEGYFETELFHGEYRVTVSHPSANSTTVHSLKVDLGSEQDHTIQV